MYLTQCLHRVAQQSPTKPAATDGAGTLDWHELRTQVAKLAGALQALGLAPGERVALLAPNGTDFLAYLLGTFWAGGVINPVNLRWTPAEIGFSLEDCSTRILIVDRSFAGLIPLIRQHAPGLRHVVVIGGEAEGAIDYAAWLAGSAPVEDMLRRGDDLAAILYTGGTTGRPKGVMLSHNNIAASVFGTLGKTGPAGAHYLHIAPLFHIGALSGLFIALFSGSHNRFHPGFDPPAVLEAISGAGVTELFMVPTMIRMLIDHPDFPRHDTASVTRIRYGASSIDAALLDRALTAFPNAAFQQAYGMTELSPVATILGPEDHGPDARRDGRLLSAGRATPTCEVRIVDENDQELPRGAIGEIVARGPNLMLGYWNQPEATAHALRGGWMHTGDMGRMDHGGYVTVVDRLKDMIISGGENIYSVEVENALSTHPQVAQVAVIAMPDARWGERVHAVIVAKPGPRPHEQSLSDHCRAAIAGYKIPKSYAFVEALPLSAAGKVLKNVLRQNARGLQDEIAGQ